MATHKEIIVNPSLTRVALAAMFSLAAGGCASIVGGSTQVVSVETQSTGQPLAGASCSMKNPKGDYFVTTPGTVTINRAYDDLVLRCTKDGFAPAVASVKSSTKGMAFGNLIFGGVIGGAVDISTGAAYDYPSLITVQMQAISAGAAPARPGPAEPPAGAAPAEARPGVEPQASRQAE